MGDFRKLRAWREAMDFAVAVYRATEGLPPAERFELRNQIRRSAASVAANLAEGAGRGTPAAFRAFTRIARGSLHESVSHVILAGRLGLLPPDAVTSLVQHADRLGPMLSGILAPKRQNG